MLLRPSNTLLLDEPTNHLDLDSKDVLLEALEDYGGTLIFVSHDRYFVEKLASKIIEVGHGAATVYPGSYTEFLWSKEHAGEPRPTTTGREPARKSQSSPPPPAPAPAKTPQPSVQRDREERKRADAERKKAQRAVEALQRRISELETRIADREAQVRSLEAQMSEPGFYSDPSTSKDVINRHQALMWEVGDLMAQWEALQEHASDASVEP